MDTTAIAKAARKGDSRAIGRLLTEVENRTDPGKVMIRELFSRGGSAWLTGITGTPGAGKSSIASSLLTLVLDEAERAAIVAVDPSSPYSGGAILGDRIRMAEHAGDSRVTRTDGPRRPAGRE